VSNLQLPISLAMAIAILSSSPAKAQAPVKKQLTDALTAFQRTVRTTRCPDCRGRGKTVYRTKRSIGGGLQRGGSQTKVCARCGGKGRVAVYTAAAKARRGIADQYGLFSVGGHELETALSAQYALERYLDLLDAAERAAPLLVKDKRLKAKFDKLRSLAWGTFRSDAALFEAIAGELARSKRDSRGAGVCFFGRIREIVPIEDQQYARLEEAGYCWFVPVPQNLRWTQEAVVQVIGRIAADTDYTTVLGANRAAIVIEPSIDTQ